MKYANGKTCELCHNSIESYGEKINEKTKDMLGFLLKLYPDLDEDALMCTACSKKLHTFYTFKGTCLRTEDQINSFVSSTNSGKLDLNDVYQQTNKHAAISYLQKDQEICRFCMKPTGSDFYTPLCEKDDVFFKLLQRYVGEVILNLTEHPIACNLCLSTLENYFNFIKNFLEEDYRAIPETSDETFASDLRNKYDTTNFNNIALPAALTTAAIGAHLTNNTAMNFTVPPVESSNVGVAPEDVGVALNPMSSNSPDVGDGNVVTQQPKPTTTPIGGCFCYPGPSDCCCYSSGGCCDCGGGCCDCGNADCNGCDCCGADCGGCDCGGCDCCGGDCGGGDCGGGDCGGCDCGSVDCGGVDCGGCDCSGCTIL